MQTIEHWHLDRFIEYARNPRKNDHAVDKVAAAIHEFGFKVPIIAKSDGLVVDGHLRLKAAKKLNLETVPVLLADDLTETQIKAFRLSVNKVAELADWDTDLLNLELIDLKELDFDLDSLGFDLSELEMYLGDTDLIEGETDPDEVPEIQEDVITKPGDIWILGNHRLMAGDSTVATDVEKLLNGVQPHLMVTDPPYGVEYDADWRNEAESVGAWGRKSTGKGCRATGKVQNDNCADWREVWALFPGDVVYVWHAGVHASSVADSLIESEFDIRAQIIWGKPRLVISRGHYHWQHEPCWYAVKKNKTGHWNGDHSQTTLWQIAHNKSETGHSTQKPVECMRKPIENNSSPGQAVYEPFSGSGTTIIAAEQTGRHCYAMEISESYVDLAVRRWQDFTGKDAVLDGDGRIFNETASEAVVCEGS